MISPTKLIIPLFVLLVPLAAFAAPPHGGDRMYPTRLGRIPEIQYISIVAELKEGKLATRIEPFSDPRLDRYTQVIWTNNAEVPVLIRFGKGPKCEEASEMRLRELDWRLDKTCYVTQKPVPPKGVLETTFTEQGRFPYEVEFVGANVTESGVITIY